MRLTSLKKGDIIRVDDGLTPYFAMVVSPPEGAQVAARALHGAQAIRRAHARDVTGVWHQSKRTDPDLAFKH